MKLQFDVRVVRFAHACGGATSASLGRVFGIGWTTVSDIIRRRTWAALGKDHAPGDQSMSNNPHSMTYSEFVNWARPLVASAEGRA
jgi:hypothetical protein